MDEDGKLILPYDLTRDFSGETGYKESRLCHFHAATEEVFVKEAHKRNPRMKKKDTCAT